MERENERSDADSACIAIVYTGDDGNSISLETKEESPRPVHIWPRRLLDSADSISRMWHTSCPRRVPLSISRQVPAALILLGDCAQRNWRQHGLVSAERTGASCAMNFPLNDLEETAS